MARGEALDDPSRGRFSHRAGLRADHRNDGAVWLGQNDCELSGTGAVGGVKRGSATAGTHHQTGQLSVELFAGGIGTSHGALRPVTRLGKQRIGQVNGLPSTDAKRKVCQF